MQQVQSTSHQHRQSRQTSFAWTSKRYVGRTPESTLLYKMVQQNFRSFEDLCALEGKRLPLHVSGEFEAFLKCGVLAHGFLRFKCEDCKFERLVAFSCKKRGFCGSCGARRMAETSVHLSDNVFPTATLIRQWVLSIPVPLRFMCFSLHAGVSVWSQNKARLEQLIRYTARPAVSEERLSQAANGDIHYKLKKPWTDGTTAVVFSPLEFLEKLASLVPPPRIHLTRFHGVLAPHSKHRKLVVPQKLEEEIAEQTGDKTLPVDNQKQNRISWAKLLSRVFTIDMNNCELCGGQMKAISAILKQDVIENILTHMGLPVRPPPIAASNIPRQEGFWDQTPDYRDYSQTH